MHTSASPWEDAPIDPEDEPLGGLERACSAWIDRGDEVAVKKWLERQLDFDGSPRRLPAQRWGPCLDLLERARRARGGWSPALDERVNGLFTWLVHASRPDGSQFFGPCGKERSRIARLVAGGELSPDPALGAVVDRWFPGTRRSRRAAAAPPLPARSDDDRVHAVLRPDWTADGDWLAIDHRAAGDATRIELAGGGRPWILGEWVSAASEGSERVTRAVPSSWSTGPHADCLEWTFRAGPTRITRTAVLLRYRNLALLAQQEDGDAPSRGFRLPLASDAVASPGADARVVTLVRGRARARLIPLGLPSSPVAPDRGSLAVEGAQAVLRQTAATRRRWLPLLVAWGKAPVQWRALTVCERSKTCPPDVAFGARISWGVGVDGLLIYRSLGRPALRSVLGYQTRARFVIGRFTPEGKVEPLVSL